MIAAKCNRTHNIDVLMSCTIHEDDVDDVENDDSDGETDDSHKKGTLQVNIDAKDKKTLTALHYAAKIGNLVSTGIHFFYIES